MLTAAGGSSSPAWASPATVRTNLGLVVNTDVQGYNANLAAIVGLTPSNDDFLQRKAGAWANRTIAQVRSDLATGTPTGSKFLRDDWTWQTVSGGSGGGDAYTNTSTSVDSEIALFSGTGGKTIKRATGSGLAYLTSGVLSTSNTVTAQTQIFRLYY